ncbi:MAG: hypothetical protein KY444_12660 [Gemmatimonadetes bacterium]|nr:hypothetical protein [Gemmatimonadota bacterium]
MLLARSPGAATLRPAARAIAQAQSPGRQARFMGGHAIEGQTPEAIRGYLEHVGQDGGPAAFEGVAGRVASIVTEIR